MSRKIIQDLTEEIIAVAKEINWISSKKMEDLERFRLRLIELEEENKNLKAANAKPLTED